MAIPTPNKIRIPLLWLIHDMGGSVKPKEVFKTLADYFKLSEEERNAKLSSGFNKFSNSVQWVRNALCDQGLLDRSEYGVWKITKEGIKELSNVGLKDKPFPSQRKFILPLDMEVYVRSVVSVLSQQVKTFPDDYIDGKTEFRIIDLPGTQLKLAPSSRTIIISEDHKKYFRYEAKNPPEAKYILYAHDIGLKQLKIPRNNLVIFKAVTDYEKHCNEINELIFQLSCDKYDDKTVKAISTEVVKRLNLKSLKNWH